MSARIFITAMFKVTKLETSGMSNDRGPVKILHILFYIHTIEYLLVIKNNEDIYIIDIGN